MNSTNLSIEIEIQYYIKDILILCMRNIIYNATTPTGERPALICIGKERGVPEKNSGFNKERCEVLINDCSELDTDISFSRVNQIFIKYAYASMVRCLGIPSLPRGSITFNMCRFTYILESKSSL